MPRSQGFARGDIDTAFPLDDKFLALRGRPVAEWNLSPEVLHYYAATGVYFHVLAATWREADRKPADKVCPDALPIIEELIAVALLDAEKSVTKRAFAHFVGRAKRARRASTERQARNRAQKSRVTNRDVRETNGDTAPLRSARTRSVGTAPQETGGAGGKNGEADPYDEAVRWLAQRQAWFDSPKIATELARLVDRKGLPAVLAAMGDVPGAEDAAQFVYGAKNALYPLSGSSVTPRLSKAEQAEADADARIEAARHRKAAQA